MKKKQVSASEFTLTNQSDFDHHAVKEKKHCTTKSEQQFSWKYIVSRKKTAIYASTKNKTKNHNDYHAEKKIEKEKLIRTT